MSTRKVLFTVQGARNLPGAVSVAFSPGLNFLEGGNGAGKTTIVESVQAWGGRKVDIPVAAGSDAIRIQGPGCMVVLGRKRQADGSPAVEFVADTAFATLIDPGDKDKALRAKNRMLALCRFSPIPIDEALLLRLSGGDELVAAQVQGKVPDWQSLTIDALADQVRIAANSLALPLEEDVKAAETESAVYFRQAEELSEHIAEIPAESAADLAGRLAALTQQLGVMKAQSATRADLEQQQANVRGSLGERPDTASARMAEVIAQEELAALRAQVAQAETRLALAKAAHATATAEEAAWLRRRQVLDAPLTGPTLAEVSSKEAEVESVREALANAEKEERRAALAAQAAERLDSASVSRLNASRFRAIAQTAKAGVGEILEEAGLEGVTFHGGSLAVQTPDGPRSVDDLSFGERVQFALRVALPAYESADLPVILYLPEAFWYALDWAHQDELEELAKRMGLYVAIERPTEGPLVVRNRSAREVRAGVAAA
ncbi:MAG TPA: hypothetical protein VLT87_11190 [Thermoanaerobaculia bacterium]|nr:hypothetical protein [Thermoanaerobaculia bacterium]